MPKLLAGASISQVSRRLDAGVRHGRHGHRDRPPPSSTRHRGGHRRADVGAAEANVIDAGLSAQVSVQQGDILWLRLSDDSFDVVEGVVLSLPITGRVLRPANIRKMAWLMPGKARAGPYLGYLAITATQPA